MTESKTDHKTLTAKPKAATTSAVLPTPLLEPKHKYLPVPNPAAVPPVFDGTNVPFGFTLRIPFAIDRFQMPPAPPPEGQLDPPPLEPLPADEDHRSVSGDPEVFVSPFGAVIETVQTLDAAGNILYGYYSTQIQLLGVGPFSVTVAAYVETPAGLKLIVKSLGDFVALEAADYPYVRIGTPTLE